MKVRSIIGTIAFAPVAIFFLGSISAGCQSKARRPNVIFILADDLGWSELGCYGNAFNETPNLDKLAKEGMRFTNAYAAAPVCSPYRAALMTGQYPARIGVTDYLRPDTDWHLPDEIDVLAEVFKKADYATGMIGKWHLSGYDNNGVKFGPGKYGFDEVMISEQTGIGSGSYFHPYTSVNEKINPILGDKEYITDRLNHEAVEFIKRNKDRSFFLYVSHYAVHTTLASKKKDLEYFSKKEGSTIPLTHGDFKREPMGQKGNSHIASMLRIIDDGLGMIMKSLDELGLAENTIVIFTSDNGGEHWVTDNIPLRSGKSSLYEGGIREPLIIKWPGVTKSGSTCDTPTTNVDFYPTFEEITGMQKPPLQHIDGLSIVPLLKGEKIHDRPLYWHYPLHEPHFLGGKSSGAIRSGDWKLIERFDNQTLELYNLSDDIGEKKDLANQQPERVRNLHTLLIEWRKDVSAKLTEGQSYAKPCLSNKSLNRMPGSSEDNGNGKASATFIESCSSNHENISYTRWNIQEPVFSSRQGHKLDNVAVKDPSIVYFQENYHLFYTAKSKLQGDTYKFHTGCAYTRASTLEDLNQAERYSIDSIVGNTIIAPQIFYFEPQKLWYLIAHTPKVEAKLSSLVPVYLTNPNIENVYGWTEAREIITGKSNDEFWIDFWVICDDLNAYLFYSNQKGSVYRLNCPLNTFPEGFSNSKPEIALSQQDIDNSISWRMFEAAHIYHIKKENKYLALLEGAYSHPSREGEVDSRNRFIFGMTADSLNGKWKRIENDKNDFLADANNLFFTDGSRTYYTQISHPELIRSGYNQKLEIEDYKLTMLFQSFNGAIIPDSYIYNELPWELALMKNY